MKKKITVTVQRRVSPRGIPAPSALREWAEKTLVSHISAAEVTLRVVGSSEMAFLNGKWRHKQKSTNVLSFPASVPGMDLLMGDVVICSDVVQQEAIDQAKPLRAHWAHMVVHGMLHLLGFDHEETQAAEQMEAEEVRILSACGFADPYKGVVA